MQPFKMMVGDMVNEEQKGKAYSIQSFLCNAGSFVGYLFPIFFTWIGIVNTAPEGVVPDSVKWSFYIGALILILCVLYTFAKVKEMNPQEYAEFHGIDPQKQAEQKHEGIISLLAHAPKAFWTVGLVQFFCWFHRFHGLGYYRRRVRGLSGRRQLGGRAFRRPGGRLDALGPAHSQVPFAPFGLHRKPGARSDRIHIRILLS